MWACNKLVRASIISISVVSFAALKRIGSQSFSILVGFPAQADIFPSSSAIFY